MTKFKKYLNQPNIFNLNKNTLYKLYSINRARFIRMIHLRIPTKIINNELEL